MALLNLPDFGDGICIPDLMDPLLVGIIVLLEEKMRVEAREKPVFIIHLFMLQCLNVVKIKYNYLFMQSPSASTAQEHMPVQPSPSQASEGSFLYLYLIAAAILIFILLTLRKKSKPSKTEIAIIGERGAGKTQLFIGLCGGKAFTTVPSITNNTSTLVLARKTLKICDFIGDNVSKEQVLSELPRFNTIIHTIDGSDSKKLSDAALFIYRVLVSKQFQKEGCNYIIFLNKADEKGFYGQEKLVKRLQDQIEIIKLSKKNLVDDNEAEEDYLKNDRSRFQIRKQQDFSVVVGSAQTDRAQLIEKLQQIV